MDRAHGECMKLKETIPGRQDRVKRKEMVPRRRLIGISRLKNLSSLGTIVSDHVTYDPGIYNDIKLNSIDMIWDLVLEKFFYHCFSLWSDTFKVPILIIS